MLTSAPRALLVALATVLALLVAPVPALAAEQDPPPAPQPADAFTSADSYEFANDVGYLLGGMPMGPRGEDVVRQATGRYGQVFLNDIMDGSGLLVDLYEFPENLDTRYLEMPAGALPAGIPTADVFAVAPPPQWVRGTLAEDVTRLVGPGSRGIVALEETFRDDFLERLAQSGRTARVVQEGAPPQVFEGLHLDSDAWWYGHSPTSVSVIQVDPPVQDAAATVPATAVPAPAAGPTDWADLLSSGQVTLGEVLGTGQEARVHALAQHPDLALRVWNEQGIFQASEWPDELESQRLSLDFLRDLGVPTVHQGVVGWSDPATGQPQVGMLMDTVPGLDLDQLFDLPASDVVGAGVTERTAADLRGILDIATAEGLRIPDFQGRIAAGDGAVAITDVSAEQVPAGSPEHEQTLADIRAYLARTEQVLADPALPADPAGNPRQTGPAGGEAGSTAPDVPAVPGGGVVIAPELPPLPGLDEVRDALFPGGDPTRLAPDVEVPGTDVVPRDPGLEELLGGGGVAPFPLPDQEPAQLPGDFGPNPELEELLYPHGPAGPRTVFPPVPEEELAAQMAAWQDELTGRGIVADSAAEVFNNHQQELSSRFGLSAQQATEALGGSYSNRVGQRITGPAIVGPAIVGPAIVGPKIVGPAIVGEGIVGEGIGAVSGCVVPELGAHQRLRLRPVGAVGGHLGWVGAGVEPARGAGARGWVAGAARAGGGGAVGGAPARARHRRRTRVPAAAAAAAELGAAGGPGGVGRADLPPSAGPRPRRLA